MDITLQSKLLKVIEDKAFRPVGSNKVIQSDVRIVSAMNVTVSRAIHDGLIRSDLFYRLAVVQMELPPLRERNDDILLLADHFLSHYTEELELKNITISELVLNILQHYKWPGNIRELKNTIESAVSVSDSTEITVHDLPEYLLYNYERPFLSENVAYEGKNLSLNQEVKNYERHLIVQALQVSSTKAEAAQKLGISRQSLRYKIEKHDIK